MHAGVAKQGRVPDRGVPTRPTWFSVDAGSPFRFRRTHHETSCRYATPSVGAFRLDGRVLTANPVALLRPTGKRRWSFLVRRRRSQSGVVSSAVAEAGAESHRPKKGRWET